MNYLVMLFMVIVSGCASIVYKTTDFERLYGPSAVKPRELTLQQSQLAAKLGHISFNEQVKPILDNRCVVCHGCYDAPCQLKLGSIEGLDRGGSKRLVYDFARLQAAEPTRLFVDAQNAAQWRNKGFHPVLNERADSQTANLDNSILAKLLQLKRLNPQATSGKVDGDYDLAFDHELQCPTVAEFAKFEHEHPKWGMPYAMPGLSLKEEFTLLQWLQEGGKVEPPPALTVATVQEIQKWEHYFNGNSLKEKLVFRYIFEHLFIGHMHFKGHAEQAFFRWVRSRTPTGQPIVEINSVRPYDDPGPQPFYYRLKPVTETIVDKNHFAYELSDEKRRLYDDLFFKIPYEVSALPSYDLAVASNPFAAFSELPMTSRYRFLLDDAHYFVSGFIKGSVCRGESATSSIRDHFWVVFMHPGLVEPKKVNEALAKHNRILGLPGEESDEIGLFGWTKYDEYGRHYLALKNEFLDSVLPPGQGLELHNVWDGDGLNQNAALTIFRHNDSATVVKGLVGDLPLTGWVVDYPIFERLHYLLVAGFNVFGTAGHQLASRTYMDIVRQDAEHNFLRFMPAVQRPVIYADWYRGASGWRTADPLFNIERESQINYRTSDVRREFFEQVRQRLGQAAGATDAINGCSQATCLRSGLSPEQQTVDSQMRRLATLKGLVLKALPEMSLLRVKTREPENDMVYTLLVNKAFSNISQLLFMDARRLPESDTLTVVPGFIGSYPNFFFSVDMEQLGEFVSAIQNAATDADLDMLYQRYGVRRTNPDIWRLSDWFNQQHQKARGLEAGLLDMNRYQNL